MIQQHFPLNVHVGMWTEPATFTS